MDSEKPDPFDPKNMPPWVIQTLYGISILFMVAIGSIIVYVAMKAAGL